MNIEAPVWNPSDMKTWKTREGAVMRIKDMGDSHLVNTIKYLERHATNMRLNQASDMFRYAATAPDGAAMCAESGAEQLLEMSDEEFLSEYPKYKGLVREAKKRKLTWESSFAATTQA